MHSFIVKNKVLLIALAAVLIVCFGVIWSRINVETQNKTYDVVLDYNELAAMAEQSDHDISWWLASFKELGINKVGIMEASIQTLMEDTDYHVTGEVMDNIKKNSNWEDEYPAEFVQMLDEHGYDSFDVIVSMEGREIIDFMLDSVQNRFQSEKYFTYDAGEEAYIYFDGTPDVTLYSQKYKYMDSKNAGYVEASDVIGSKIMNISLGLLPEEVETAQAAGCEVIPRTMSYGGWNDTKYAEAVVAGYEKYGIVPKYLIVGGQSVIGYDDGIDFAKNYIKDNDITIGLIENTTQLQNIMQDGVDEVAIDTDFDAVRIFSVWNYIQYRYQYYGYEGAEEIENTLFRAISERNVRVIYFKPILEHNDLHTYITDFDEYEQLFTNLAERLERHHISFDNAGASIMENVQVPMLAKIILALGCVIAAIILLRSFLPLGRKASFVLAVLGALGVLGAAFVIPNTFELVLSLSSCMIFGCLAVTCYVSYAKRSQDEIEQNAPLLTIIVIAGIALIVSVLIAFAGGLMTAAPLSATNYMLEIDIFRGVKIGQLLPIAYFVVAYLAYFGYSEHKKKAGNLEFHDIKALLNADIKVWMIAAGVCLLAVGYYYIARTGHDSGFTVSSAEMIFRNELEDLFIARPRTKEFLIAFPSIMLMIYCAVRRFKLWSILFGIAGVLGVTSVINTFEHIRTPLYLGFHRTALSLLFGLVLGAIGIIVFDFIHKMYVKHLKKFIEGLDV